MSMKKVFKQGLVGLVSLLSIGLVVAETNAQRVWKFVTGNTPRDLNLPSFLGADNITIILLGMLLWIILYSVMYEHQIFSL